MRVNRKRARSQLNSNAVEILNQIEFVCFVFAQFLCTFAYMITHTERDGPCSALSILLDLNETQQNTDCVN